MDGGTVAKGRGDQMTCSFRVAHFPHNRLPFSPNPPFIFSLHILHFIFLFVPQELILYTLTTHPHTKLSLPSLSYNANDLVLSWINSLI